MELKLNIDTDLENEAQILTELGFRENQLGKDKPVEVWDEGDDGYFSIDAIKTYNDQHIAVCIVATYHKQHNTITYAELDVYEYEGKRNSHTNVRTLTPAESIPYLADLIEREIVEVVE